MDRVSKVVIHDPKPADITAEDVALAVGSRYKIVASNVKATELEREE